MNGIAVMHYLFKNLQEASKISSKKRSGTKIKEIEHNCSCARINKNDVMKTRSTECEVL